MINIGEQNRCRSPRMRNIRQSRSKFDECIAFLRGRSPRIRNIQQRRAKFDEYIAFLLGRGRGWHFWFLVRGFLTQGSLTGPTLADRVETQGPAGVCQD